MLIIGCRRAANEWEENARDRGGLYCTQQRENGRTCQWSSTVEMTPSVFKRITFSVGALQMRQHPSSGHNTNHSIAPFCTYANSYGPLRQIHCLIARGKCIQMFCFRCVTDLIKRLWIYLLGLKKIISSMYYPIITSITCYVLIGELLISVFEGPGLIFRSPIYKSLSDPACCLAWATTAVWSAQEPDATCL